MAGTLPHGMRYELTEPTTAPCVMTAIVRYHEDSPPKAATTRFGAIVFSL